MTHVKICGVTTEDDAQMCVRAGASAIGLNFVAASPRRVDAKRARSIARAAREAESSVLVVGVVADLDVAAMLALRDEAELGCLQLHGDEPPEDVLALLPHAYKAVRIGEAADVARAEAYPGEHLLVDAKVAGALGGTGATFDWALAAPLARSRRLTLAGGLGPHNVAEAVFALRPFCVDVASGVELPGRPGEKDPGRVAAFIAAVRAADAG